VDPLCVVGVRLGVLRPEDEPAAGDPRRRFDDREERRALNRRVLADNPELVTELRDASRSG